MFSGNCSAHVSGAISLNISNSQAIYNYIESTAALVLPVRGLYVTPLEGVVSGYSLNLPRKRPVQCFSWLTPN